MSQDEPQNQTTLTQPLAALREQTLHRLRNGLRRGQQSMADWQGGQLAVSAVPGAGKSTGMAVAAAFAIAPPTTPILPQMERSPLQANSNYGSPGCLGKNVAGDTNLIEGEG